MKRGYNELVGMQATFSKVISQYSLAHFYRWRNDVEKKSTTTIRGYDMHRHIPVNKVVQSLCDAYAPAICAIYRQVTNTSLVVFFQLAEGASPLGLRLDGVWDRWAQE